MKKTLMFGLGLFAASVVALTVGKSVLALNPLDTANCEIGYKASQLGKGFTANSDNTVSYTVVIKGDASCRKDIVMASFKIPHATLQPYPVEEQTLFAYTTIKDAAPGEYTLKVNVPECFYQVDVARGLNPTGPNGRLPYEDHRLIDAYLGGKEACKDKPVVEKPVVKPAVKETPKVLPETGAGSVVGIVASTTVGAGLAHSLVMRRRNDR